MSRRGDGAYARNPPLSSRRQADTRKRSSGWELIRGMILKMVNKLIGSAKRRSIISKIAKTFLRGRFRISESMNRPPLSERRSVLLFGRCIKAGVQIIDVFAVHPLLGQTQRLAKSLEVDNLPFPEELDGIVDIGIVGKA